MGDCELCGATKTGTRRAKMKRTWIEACKRCIDRMGLETESAPAPAPRATPATSQRARPRTSGGYGGLGTKGKDIMLRREKELRSDYANAIKQARTAKGWDQRELAKRMAERVNIIQHTEGGKRPTDAVIKKFERILEIELMVERAEEQESNVRNTTSRNMTMADFFDQAKKNL